MKEHAIASSTPLYLPFGGASQYVFKATPGAIKTSVYKMVYRLHHASCYVNHINTRYLIAAPLK